MTRHEIAAWCQAAPVAATQLAGDACREAAASARAQGYREDCATAAGLVAFELAIIRMGGLPWIERQRRGEWA
jgi:hypothetical protein